jgi:hypothetical protein
VPSFTPFTSLSAVSTGTGSVFDMDVARTNITMVVSVSGTALSGSVALDLSQDNERWVQSGTSLSVASNSTGQVTSTGGAWRYARARVASNITGGATVTATISESY